MRRMFGLLLVLFLIYFGIQIGFRFIDKGHTENYSVETNGKTFAIKEVFTVNTKEDDNYYLEITVDGITFDLQIFDDLKMAKKIVSDVYYYDRDFTCIFPLFEGKMLTDMICKEDDTYYQYSDIKGRSSALDNYVSLLKTFGYNEYVTNDSVEKHEGISIYDNLLDNHYLAMENYKGIYTINTRNLQKIYNTTIFENDVYQNRVSSFINNYYLVANADYQNQTKFNSFKLINLVNNKVKEIKYDYDISLDSYVLGTHDNKVYIFDNDTKKEYEVDSKTETIIEVGNPNTGIKIYRNGEFVQENAYSVYQNKMVFEPYEISHTFNNQNYALVIKQGVEKSGYYYIFEAFESGYRVYRSNIQNGVNKTYLFVASSTDLLYDKDNVYYVNGSSLMRYNNKTGNQKIIDYKELSFNSAIKIGLYTK